MSNNQGQSSKTARNRARRRRRAQNRQRARQNQNQNQNQAPAPQPQQQQQVNRRGRGRGGYAARARGRGRGYGGGGYRGRGGRRPVYAGRGRVRGRGRGNYGSGARSYNSKKKKEDKKPSMHDNDKDESGNFSDNEQLLSNMKYTDEGIADSKQKEMDEEQEEKVAHLNIEQLQTLFLGENKINDHINALHNNREKYMEQLRLFIKYGVISKVSTSTKAKILCALLIRNERSTVEWLMSHQRYYSVGEIAKCIQLLDAPRKGLFIDCMIYSTAKSQNCI